MTDLSQDSGLSRFSGTAPKESILFAILALSGFWLMLGLLVWVSFAGA